MAETASGRKREGAVNLIKALGCFCTWSSIEVLDRGSGPEIGFRSAYDKHAFMLLFTGACIHL